MSVAHSIGEMGHSGNKKRFNGADYVQGLVRINGIPSRAFVVLFDTEYKLLLAQQWTDADGVFRFDLVDAARQCFVVAFDTVTGEKAEVYDRI